MTKFEVPLVPAPSTPLNLQVGILYAPRTPTPPWLAHQVTEPEPGVWLLTSYGGPDFVSVARLRSLVEAWTLLAQVLGMD